MLSYIRNLDIRKIRKNWLCIQLSCLIGFVPSAFAAMVVSLIAVRAIAIITKESDEPSDLSFAIGVGIGCMAFLALIGFSIYLGFVLMNAETGDTDDDNGM